MSAIAAVAGVAVGAVALLGPFEQAEQRDAVASTPVSTPTGGTATPVGPASSAAVAPGLCGNPATGEPLDCTAPAAWLSVGDRACTMDAALAGWGVDQDLAVLLIEVRVDHGTCWLAPAVQARTAGATALDLRRVSGASVPAVLRACARGTHGENTVSCATAHELEWVGPWRAVDTREPTAVCQALARRYTNRAIVDPTSGIESVVVQGKGANDAVVTRCALRAGGTTLVSTLAGISGSPLPTA